MWIEEYQKYNELVWVAETENCLKKILLNEMGLSVRLVVLLKKGNNFFINNKKATTKDTVTKGDIVKVKLKEEENEYASEEMSLSIYYEDEDLLIIDKPYGAVVHPTRSHYNGTILNGLLHYFKQQDIKSKIRFVNRLDCYTSGLLIVAKNPYAHHILTKNDAMWEMGKTYTAVVGGLLDGKGTINKSILHLEGNPQRLIAPNGQNAVTHYTSLKATEKASILQVELETGRTHQIRVHLSSIGHPILGDELYGGDTSMIDRQALHSSKLEFYSPRKKEKITIKTELPSDLRELVNKLFYD